jgi:chorismate mutase
MIRAALVVLALALAAPTSATASEERAASVYELIAQRLALMQPVAAWKHVNGVPVEDREREVVVIERATAGAAKHGLASATVGPFFEAQIEAAKAIQRCWIARWSSGVAAAPIDPPDLKADIRPNLIKIGNLLTAAIQSTLGNGSRFESGGAAAFARAVDLDCLDRESRGAIYAALIRIRLVE